MQQRFCTAIFVWNRRGIKGHHRSSAHAPPFQKKTYNATGCCDTLWQRERRKVAGKCMTTNNAIMVLRAPVLLCQVTTNLLWTLYCLSRSADVQDAVYRDTVAVLAGTCGHVTPDALQRLHYIRACIKETSRLHPIQPYLIICHFAIVIGLPLWTFATFSFMPWCSSVCFVF